MPYGARSYGETTYGDGIGGTYIAYIPNTTRQDAVWQADENIGFAANPSQDGAFQADENIGFAANPSQDGAWQADENIGVAQPGNVMGFLRRRGI